MAKIVRQGVKIYAESAEEYTQLVADASANAAFSNIIEAPNDGAFGSITIDIDELGS